MALSIVGGMLIPVSLYGLRRKQILVTESKWQMPLCATPSPDQSLRCKQELGHLGWHEDGMKSWFGDCWFEEQTVGIKRLEYVGRSAATSKPRRTQPKPPQAAPPKPPQPKPSYPNIIGPEPIKVRVGMFGTRRTLPNDRDRKSA